jgi:TetR/AcrR family transcriptional regulator, acrAB operon repressor
MARRTKEAALETRAQIIDAARRVFHAEGVNRSTLDKVAKAAGVTRGAVYWHFANKAEIFLAVKQTYTSEFDQLQSLLSPQEDESPLDALGNYLQQLFSALLSNTAARETYEIMMLRCEYVEEFGEVLQIITEPCTDILEAFDRLYREAVTRRELKPGLDPALMALDTLAFARGTLRAILSGQQHIYGKAIKPLIQAHIDLRRA